MADETEEETTGKAVGSLKKRYGFKAGASDMAKTRPTWEEANATFGGKPAPEAPEPPQLGDKGYLGEDRQQHRVAKKANRQGGFADKAKQIQEGPGFSEPAPADGQDRMAYDDAQALYEEGMEAWRAGDTGTAADKFWQSNRLYPSKDSDYGYAQMMKAMFDTDLEFLE